MWKSCASWPSKENEFEDRADSSYDLRNDDIEVILLMPNTLGRFCIRGGPGSLSTVANDIDDMRPIL